MQALMMLWLIRAIKQKLASAWMCPTWRCLERQQENPGHLTHRQHSGKHTHTVVLKTKLIFPTTFSLSLVNFLKSVNLNRCLPVLNLAKTPKLLRLLRLFIFRKHEIAYAWFWDGIRLRNKARRSTLPGDTAWTVYL